MNPIQISVVPAKPAFFNAARVAALQGHLRQHLLNHRTSPSSKPVPPYLFVFEPAPIYSIGRSQPKLSMLQSHALKSDLKVWSRRSDYAAEREDREPELQEHDCQPEVVSSATRDVSMYYGPGQLRLWTAADLKSTPSLDLKGEDYEGAIGSVTIKLLRDMYGLNLFHRPGSGIWTDSTHFKEQRQIADISVQNDDDIVTGGVTLNLDIPVSGGEEVNPWARLAGDEFVGEGVQFHRTTSVAAELGDDGHVLGRRPDLDMDLVMRLLGQSVAHELGMGETDIVSPEEAFGDDWMELGQRKGGIWGDIAGLVGFNIVLALFD
ncbi:Uu.00g059770.m01.CDS01 [Anthostomella pinea]|uniref:Uu.00g059770.m01.CDS01 n=1 Tax=Anthostomella pinea TaxID=933095 RepID=A0AAI8VTB1_9PEZI|nr:Uu.00g059770.m01.CDS01 [Anthostomella pinea]